MSLDQTTREELIDLIAKMGTDLFDNHAKDRLDELMQSSEEACQLYQRHCQTEAILRQGTLLASVRADLATPQVASPRIRFSTLVYAAALIVLVGTIAVLLLRPPQTRLAPFISVARVTSLEGRVLSNGSPLTVGAELSAGDLSVEEGNASLTLNSGVTLKLESSSRLKLESDIKVHLSQGRLAADVPEEGQEFVLMMPNSAIADRGMQFGVVVQEEGSWIQVYDGLMDVAILDKHGQAWKSKRLETEQSVKIDSSKMTFVDEVAPTPPPQLTHKTYSLDGLKVSPDYVSTIIQDNPVHYWRFSKLEAQESVRLVHDEMNQSPLTITGGSRLHDQAIYFRLRLKNRGIAYTQTPNPEFNTAPFTIEVWIKPLTQSRRKFLSIFGPAKKRNGQFRELYSLGTTNLKENGIYPAQRIRFSRRNNPKESQLNLFSKNNYEAGQWHHVVAIRKPDALVLFLNGVKVGEVDASPLEDSKTATALSLGGHTDPLPEQWRKALFVGMLDEVAIYPYVLTPEQIKRHYALMDLP